jgi:cytochrome c
MKRLLICALLGAMTSGSALADAGLDLAKAKNCLACHSVANKVVGPSYKDVAAKFSAQKGAEDMLVQKIMKGSKGTWGAIPMPANPQVSEAEAHALVKWILSLK